MPAIALADLLRDMGEVEFDRTATGSLEVDEQRAVPGVEDVPGVWLAVQQLLRGTSPGDHGHHATERVHQKVTVSVAELRSPVAAPDEELSFPDPIREMRRRDIDAAACRGEAARARQRKSAGESSRAVWGS